MQPASITILTEDSRWKGLAPTVKRAAQAVLSSSVVLGQAPCRADRGNAPLPSRFSCAIALANDAAIQALNQQYRGKHKATNVLSFPDGTAQGPMMQEIWGMTPLA